MYLYSYALKQFREKTDALKEEVLNKYIQEASNLSKLQHSNIVKCIECFVFKAKFYIVMEICEVNYKTSLLNSNKLKLNSV